VERALAAHPGTQLAGATSKASSISAEDSGRVRFGQVYEAACGKRAHADELAAKEAFCMNLPLPVDVRADDRWTHGYSQPPYALATITEDAGGTKALVPKGAPADPAYADKVTRPEDTERPTADGCVSLHTCRTRGRREGLAEDTESRSASARGLPPHADGERGAGVVLAINNSVAGAGSENPQELARTEPAAGSRLRVVAVGIQHQVRPGDS